MAKLPENRKKKKGCPHTTKKKKKKKEVPRGCSNPPVGKPARRGEREWSFPSWKSWSDTEEGRG